MIRLTHTFGKLFSVVAPHSSGAFSHFSDAEWAITTAFVSLGLFQCDKTNNEKILLRAVIASKPLLMDMTHLFGSTVNQINVLDVDGRVLLVVPYLVPVVPTSTVHIRTYGRIRK